MKQIYRKRTKHCRIAVYEHDGLFYWFAYNFGSGVLLCKCMGAE